MGPSNAPGERTGPGESGTALVTGAVVGCAPPHAPGESILARGLGRHVLWVGLLMALLAGGVGYAYWAAGLAQWQTMVFTVIVLAQMAHVLAIRSERESLFTVGLGSNRPLLGAVALAVALQLGLVYWPPAQALFGTVPLSGIDLALAVALSSAVFWTVEVEKWLGRRVNHSSLGHGSLPARLVRPADRGPTHRARPTDLAVLTPPAPIAPPPGAGASTDQRGTVALPGGPATARRRR